MTFLLTSQAIFCKKYELAGTVVPEPEYAMKRREKKVSLKRRKHGRGRRWVKHPTQPTQAPPPPKSTDFGRGYVGQGSRRPPSWDNGDW